MTTLSIIVPVYNKVLYLESTIDSILHQTFRDFKLILINDGSTDGSDGICEEYALKDDRILVIHQRNAGVSAARNAGLKAANGTYIGFVDADDTVEPDMYESLLNTARQHDADLCMCGVKKIFPDKVEAYYGTEKTRIFTQEEALSGFFRKEFSRGVYDKIYKASLVRNIWFERSITEDVYFNFLALVRAEKTVFIDVLKYNYIIRENSVSMGEFSNKSMDAAYFARKMTQTCKESIPNLTEDALAYEFVINLSLLNLLLTSDKEIDKAYYQSITENLKDFRHLRRNQAITSKQRMAYYFFKISPSLYEKALHMYCKIADADIAKRKEIKEMKEIKGLKVPS